NALRAARQRRTAPARGGADRALRAPGGGADPLRALRLALVAQALEAEALALPEPRPLAGLKPPRRPAARLQRGTRRAPVTRPPIGAQQKAGPRTHARTGQGSQELQLPGGRICPRSAPPASTGVAMLTCHLPASKWPTSAALMGASSADQCPISTESLLSTASLPPVAALSTSAASASSTPVELTSMLSVYALLSTVVATTPPAAGLTERAS